MNLSKDRVFKVLLIGDSGTGKSNIITKYTENKFSESTKTTIGVDFASKSIEVDGNQITLQIWDTAGQERFRSVAGAFFRGSHAVVMVYSITSKSSFQSLNKWLEENERYGEEDSILCLAGNKVDLNHLREVSKTEGRDFAISRNMLFFETSAKDSTNIQECFDAIGKQIYEYMTSTNEPFPKRKAQVPIKINDPNQMDSKKNKKGCQCG